MEFSLKKILIIFNNHAFHTAFFYSRKIPLASSLQFDFYTYITLMAENYHWGRIINQVAQLAWVIRCNLIALNATTHTHSNCTTNDANPLSEITTITYES